MISAHQPLDLMVPSGGSKTKGKGKGMGRVLVGIPPMALLLAAGRVVVLVVGVMHTILQML